MNHVYVTTQYDIHCGPASFFVRVNKTQDVAVELAFDEAKESAGDYEMPNDCLARVKDYDISHKTVRVQIYNEPTDTVVEEWVIERFPVGE